MFDVPQILTNGTGDPMRSTMTLIMYLNKHLFSKTMEWACIIRIPVHHYWRAQSDCIPL